MSDMKKRVHIFLAGVLALLLISGCGPREGQSSPEQTPDASASCLSTWAVYWDFADAEAELAMLRPVLGSVCVFEAYFSERDAIILPEQFADMTAALESAGLADTTKRYITVVNDLQLEDGTFSLKDTDLLKRLFATPRSQAAHIEALLALTLEGGYDGLELDYEAIKGDEELWTMYSGFLAQLQEKMVENNLLLRVVLEPFLPYATVEFPSGIEYVVMCYNLYGGHSGPGPKADKAFLNQVVEHVKTLPGDTIYALATGGYDWDETEKATALTESKAVALSRQTGAQTYRDDQSGCMTFTYQGDSGNHQVWYADSQTLTLWIDTLNQATGRQPDIALWRIGGNLTLDALSTSALASAMPRTTPQAAGGSPRTAPPGRQGKAALQVERH